MQRFKVIGDEGPRDLNGDFRSLGSSGVFEALPGSRYGSSVDLTDTGAKPRPLPRALQPKTAKIPQQQGPSFSSSSYRHPVVALPPPKAPVTRGLAPSESDEGRRRQGYGNHGDRSLGNRLRGSQNFGSQTLLAPRPNSIQNQSSMTRWNSESAFDQVTPTVTPGTAQANAQTQWIERAMRRGGAEGQGSRGRAERENRTAQSNDVGYRSVPLSNFRNRRNSSGDLDPMWKSSAPNAQVTCSKATISLAKPQRTRYGSLFDLSKDYGPTTEGGGRGQTGSEVIGHGLFPRGSTGVSRMNGTSVLSKEPDEEPVFGSSYSSSFSKNARESRNPDTSGIGGSHVTGNTWNRGFDAAAGRSSGTPVVAKRLENWNKTEKTTPGDPISTDYLTYGNGSSSSLAFRSRKFSFDQILPQKQNDFRSHSTSMGPAMTSSNGPPKPQGPQVKGPAPWARAIAAPGPFRERSHSTATLNRSPRGGSSGGDIDPSTALLALRSSRYPSAQMTDDCEGDSMMSASERVASSPWAAKATAPPDSGEKNMGHHHHNHHNHQWISGTKSPVESRLESSSVASHFEEISISRRQRSSVSSAPVMTSEATGNQREHIHSTKSQPAHDVISYSTAPSHMTSSSRDVRGEDSFIRAPGKSFEPRPKENSNLDLGNMVATKSSSPVPLPSYTWQTLRRNSLPVVSLERKEPTTKTRGGGSGGGGNYESIFSKGDWINAARMTWKSPSRTESPVAGKPASSSTYGPGNFQGDWKTTSGSESSSANQMTSSLPVQNSETFGKSEAAVDEKRVQNYSRNSEYLHEPGADSRSDSTTISREKATSSIPESNGEWWSGAILRENPTTEEASSAFRLSEREEAISKNDSQTADRMKFQQNTEPIEDSGDYLERPDPAHNSQRMPEEIRQSEISVIGSTKSSDSTENNVNSTVLTSEQNDATLALHDTNSHDTSIVNRHVVAGDVGSQSPVTRVPTKTKHTNWKEWYYSGLERTTDADQSYGGYGATQVSDHESGYQSSGPTLDDPPPADRKTVHKEKMVHPEDPEDSVRIFQNGSDSDAENKDSFISTNPPASVVVEKTVGSREDGYKRKCDVPVVLVDSSGSSGRSPEDGGTRELEIHVRASPLGVGFSIEGGLGSTSGDRPITVKRIFTGGDHLSDKLKPGDAIVRVNDKDFTRMTHYEAWNYLKTLPEGPASFLVQTN